MTALHAVLAGKICRVAILGALGLVTLHAAASAQLGRRGSLDERGAAEAGSAKRDDPSDKKPAARPIRVTMRAQTRVPGRFVLVGDCATLDGVDAAQAKSLETARLGRAPRGTWSRNVTREDVQRALEERGVSKDALVWKGSDSCTVFAQTVRITSEDLVRAAEAVLRDALEDEGEVDADWTVESKLRPILVPRGRSSRRLHASTGPARIAPNSARIRVDVLVDDQAWTAVSVAFRIRRFRNAVVARRAFRLGDPIHAHSVMLQRLDVAARQGELLTSFEQLRGKVAARNIRSGEALVLSDLEMPAIVRKNDTVTVVAAVGRVRIARKGVALAAGGRGDRVPVQVEPKRPPLTGEVIAPGLILVGGTARSNGAARPAASRRETPGNTTRGATPLSRILPDPQR